MKRAGIPNEDIWEEGAEDKIGPQAEGLTGHWGDGGNDPQWRPS